jgi:hypothetical protein
LVVGKQPRGRFNHIGNGTIGGDGPIVFENAHPAMIDEALFRKVQAKLARRAMTKRTRSNGYVLSGLLVCGHSGDRMHGHVAHGGRLRYYTGFRRDGDPTGPQQCFRVQQEPIERFVVGRVADLLNAPDVAGRLRENVGRRLRARPATAQAAKGIKARIEALDARLAKGAERLLLLDAADLPEASAALAAWRAERRKLAEEMGRLAAPGAGSPADETARVIGELDRLREDFAATDPDRLRAALQATIADVTLYWNAPAGPRKWRRLQRGIIRFRDESAVALSRPIRTSPPCSTAS